MMVNMEIEDMIGLLPAKTRKVAKDQNQVIIIPFLEIVSRSVVANVCKTLSSYDCILVVANSKLKCIHSAKTTSFIGHCRI